jgi:hypothetical protein
MQRLLSHLQHDTHNCLSAWLPTVASHFLMLPTGAAMEQCITSAECSNCCTLFLLASINAAAAAAVLLHVSAKLPVPMGWCCWELV